jgi:hypothetical protein
VNALSVGLSAHAWLNNLITFSAELSNQCFGAVLREASDSACVEDAIRFCSDEEQVYNCLVAHKDISSSACSEEASSPNIIAA